jgi:transcriptional regulator with XRE-family HTH domain
MTDLQKLLASNMKVYRSFLGLSQAKLAERINTASNYIALIEIGKRFPSPQMLDRIAKALEIEASQLFSKRPSEEELIRKLHKELIADINQVITNRLAELWDPIKQG